MPPLDRKNSPDLRKFFRYGQWRGAAETICGKGSTMDYTKGLRSTLVPLLNSLKVQTFLDAPCGDLNWIKEVDLGPIEYIGMDIVEEIIRVNKERFAQSDRRFLVGDITCDELPQADLIMVRDCLFHLPLSSIGMFLENFLRSGIRYLLATCNTNGQNAELTVPGQFRPVNLLSPPFSLPEPAPNWRLRDFPDGTPERYMMLWTREQISGSFDPKRFN